MAKKPSKVTKPAPKKAVKKTVKAAASVKAKKPAPKSAAKKVKSVAKPLKKPAAPIKKKVVKAKKAAPRKPVTKKAKAVAKKPIKKPAAKVKKTAAKPKKSPQLKKSAPKSVVKKAPPAKVEKPKSKSKPVAPAKTVVAKKLILPPLKPMTPRKPITEEAPEIVIPKKSPFSASFLKKQKQRLQDLRNSLMDAMEIVAKDSLGTRPEGSEASVGGMHMADAGSDAYDRDFALSLLSKEQDALYEINEALKRIDLGSYGICEMTGKPVNEDRLEALPFARYTREAKEQLERDQMGGRGRRVPVRSVFGLEDDKEDEDEDEEASTANTKKSDNESSLDFIKE